MISEYLPLKVKLEWSLLGYLGPFTLNPRGYFNFPIRRLLGSLTGTMSSNPSKYIKGKTLLVGRRKRRRQVVGRKFRSRRNKIALSGQTPVCLRDFKECGDSSGCQFRPRASAQRLGVISRYWRAMRIYYFHLKCMLSESPCASSVLWLCRRLSTSRKPTKWGVEQTMNVWTKCTLRTANAVVKDFQVDGEYSTH